MIDPQTVVLQHEYVLVRPLAEPERPDGSRLFRPDAARGPQQRGIVLAVGPGEPLPVAPSWLDRLLRRTPRRPMALAPGDLAYFGRYAGFALDERETAFVMRDLEIPVYVAARSFVLVEHAEPTQAHLLGEDCAICEAAAADRVRSALGTDRPKAFPLGGA